MKFRVRAASLVVWGALSALSSGLALADAPATAKVVSGAGSSVGGLFTAGPEGAELALPSGAHLRLSAGGAVRVFGQPQRLDLDRSGKTPTWSVSLTRGRLDLDVPAKPKNALLISTERGSVFVLNGRASVLAEASDLFVVNESGSVRSYIDNRWTTIEVNHLSHIDAEHPMGADETLLPSPALASSRRMWFAAGEAPELEGFGWQAVVGARGYQLELREGERVLATRTTDATHLTGALGRFEPGDYQLVVRAIDAHGFVGHWSEPRALRVIGIDLPKGAYVENGGIFLTGGQKVRFSHTDGLEMTYVGAGRYLPASEQVGLYRNERTVVSFRFPNSQENVIARLEPRDVYAQVFAGPKKAVWPRDRIELSVRLRTRAGGPVPAFLNVVPNVSLGVEHLNVEWRREGDELHAVVPPAIGSGPWVIRVEVADQYGIPLGRDFVEVLGQPSQPRERAQTPKQSDTRVSVTSPLTD